MHRRAPENIIQNAIDIQEQCVPVRPGPARDYMIGVLNGLKYGKYAISGGNIDYNKTSTFKKIRHKSTKKLK